MIIRKKYMQKIIEQPFQENDSMYHYQKMEEKLINKHKLKGNGR